MTHRGPNDEGHYLNQNVALGMRRLSIIDIQGGHQPISNEDNTIQIVFNGEIYNFQELRSFLESAGHRFKTRSDTEVIVHLYEEYGEKCVNHLRGMFSFAIWDDKKRRLFVARDHVGKKPLFYSKNAQSFYFASELPALLSQHSQPVIDQQSLYHYLSFQYIPSPKRSARFGRRIQRTSGSGPSIPRWSSAK
jgi:asparagine synthase (glutamine-hydrolysing)